LLQGVHQKTSQRAVFGLEAISPIFSCEPEIPVQFAGQSSEHKVAARIADICQMSPDWNTKHQFRFDETQFRAFL
jgi:hypothetical protein